MKRLDLIIYQLVLSAILVSFGILFELKSVDNTPYVSTVFLTIPGSVILFGTAFSHIKKMNFKIFIITSLALSILVINTLTKSYSSTIFPFCDRLPVPI